jgi:adenosylcobinamide-GDP ribazoletransferase
MGFWAALQFLTIFPTPLRHDADSKIYGQSLTYFPLVGLLLGSILLGLQFGLKFLLPDTVTNALLVATLVILTGAHHLDGLIDTFDGIFAGRSKEERLAIMSDTSVGTFGIASVILLLLLKYACLFHVSMVPALLLMPTLSRWVMVMAIFIFPYARQAGMGMGFKQAATWQRITVASAIAIIAAIALLTWKGLILIAALCIIVFSVTFYFRSRFGGLTGDIYGAINEIAEVSVLILLILIGRLNG